MRWEPLLFIFLIAGLIALAMIAIGPKHRWLAFLILGYCTSLATILFTPISVSGTALYLMPLGTGQVNLTRLAFANLGFLENIILTIPLGLILKATLPKWPLLGVALTGLLIGSGIETTQYFLSHDFLINRSSDINDVLANALGILIGGILMASYQRIRLVHHKRTARQLAS